MNRDEQPISDQTIYPTLSYRDAPAAIDFLERAFGFESAFATPLEDGKIAHAELRAGGAMIMLGSSETVIEVPDDFKAAPQSIYIAIEDVDAHHQRARAAGATILYEPRDTEYGSREYGARDLEGHHWFFGTYRPSAG